MARKLNGIELTRYDDLFKTDEERSTDRQERVQIVPAEQVFPYARQPYSVDRPSADLVRLMDSIERTGIAEPLIVRPRSEGGYEIISGHRRDYCAKVVGLDNRPVIVRNYSDEDAQRLKQISAEGKLENNIIDLIMREEKPLERKVTLRNDRLQKYFPASYTPKQMEEVIIKLLEGWHRRRQQEQTR